VNKVTWTSVKEDSLVSNRPFASLLLVWPERGLLCDERIESSSVELKRERERDREVSSQEMGEREMRGGRRNESYEMRSKLRKLGDSL